jgi:hypothetical protein
VGKVLRYLLGILTLGLFRVVPSLLGRALRRPGRPGPAAPGPPPVAASANGHAPARNGDGPVPAGHGPTPGGAAATNGQDKARHGDAAPLGHPGHVIHQ